MKYVNHKEFSQDGAWEVCKSYWKEQCFSTSYHQYFRCFCGSKSHTVEVSVDECGEKDLSPYTFNVCWLGAPESSFIPLWDRIRGAINYVLRRDRELYHHILTLEEPDYEKFAKAVNDAKELVVRLNKQYAENKDK